MAKASEKDKGGVHLSRREVVVVVSLVFAGMTALFALGVYVGRGMSPVQFDIQDIYEELALLKQKTLQTQSRAVTVQDPDFDFQEHLKGGGEDLLFDPEEKSGPDPDKMAEAALPDDRPLKAHNMPELVEDPESKPGWTIQVSAVTVEADALRLANKLKKKNYPAYVAEVRRTDKATLYRVRVGHFTDYALAERAHKSVTALIPGAILVRKKGAPPKAIPKQIQINTQEKTS